MEKNQQDAQERANKANAAAAAEARKTNEKDAQEKADAQLESGTANAQALAAAAAAAETLPVAEPTNGYKAGDKLGSKMLIVSATGARMIHQFTNVEFNERPQRVVVDGFVDAQLAAGKLVEFKDE